MKIISNDVICDITEKIKTAEKKLKQSVYILSSINHLDHIATYIAWKNVGGNVFIKNPNLPINQFESLKEKITNFQYTDSIIFHTSGTTGTPKIVVHKKEQMNQSMILSTEYVGFHKETKFLNFLPASTIGFWNLIISTLVHHDYTIHLGSLRSLYTDFYGDVNSTIIVPSLIDQLISRNTLIDFSKFSKISTGSSQVLYRHAKFCFENGAKIFTNLYGTTETGTPVLARDANQLDEFVEYLELNNNFSNQFKIVNNELLIKGLSVCENLNDFTNTEWINTNDLFDQTGNLIKFIGRKNDIVKINGFQCSLLLIEKIAEENLLLGDCLAVVRHNQESTWIELFYTNKEVFIDKMKYRKVLENSIYSCHLPKKYTYIDSIPKNIMGKKMRNIL